MKHELKTLKDIFNKIPANRIEVCMKEITEALLQCKGYEAAYKQLDKKAQSIFPDVIIWEDDGKGEVSIHHVVNKKYICTTITNVDE